MKKLCKFQLRKVGLGLMASFLTLTFISTFPSLATSQVRMGISYQTYVPPPWAPPYDNVSSTEYYYLPDYDMYYDVRDGNFWYLNGDSWIFSVGLPPMYADIDLNRAYIVLIDRHVRNPWYNHEFYERNYPRHSYDDYQNIVVHDRIVRNIEPNHELVPRAYNENNRRVTFMQHPVGGTPPTSYHRVAHEVPIRTIAPSMPKESRSYNYGGASNRPRNTQPPIPSTTATPNRGNAPRQGGNSQGGNPHGGGNSHDGGNSHGGDGGGGKKH